MKTMEEKFKEIEDKMHGAEKLIKKISLQRVYLDTNLFLSYMPTSGTIQVRFDPTVLWSEFSFLEGAVIYHTENYFTILRELLTNVAPLEDDTLMISVPKNISDPMSYEFDSFITKFYQTMENPTINDIEKVVKSASSKKELEFIKTKRARQNIDSLYWYVHFFRIVAVHRLDPRYAKHQGSAGRFKQISSEANILDVSSDSIILPCFTLIDLRKAMSVKHVIQKEIIDKRRKESILDILFSEKTPSGYGKKAPFFLMHGHEPFDLLNGFCELILETGEYLESVNKIFFGSMGDNKKKLGNVIYGEDDKGNPLTATTELFD